MANNIIVKDASAATITVKTTDNAGVHTPHHNLDNTVAVTGDVSVRGGVAIVGPVMVSGEVSVRGTVSIVGPVSVASTVQVVGNVSAAITAITVAVSVSGEVSGRGTFNVAGDLGAIPESSVVRVSGVATLPKFSVVNASAIGSTQIVAAVVSKKLRVLSMFLVAAATANVRVFSSASGQALTGPIYVLPGGGVALPWVPAGWFETEAGKPLSMALDTAVPVGGSVTYIEV